MKLQTLFTLLQVKLPEYTPDDTRIEAEQIRENYMRVAIYRPNRVSRWEIMPYSCKDVTGVEVRLVRIQRHLTTETRTEMPILISPYAPAILTHILHTKTPE